MNKTGLTIPPVNAPALPVGHIYKVKLFTPYSGSPYWRVRIIKQKRFGFWVLQSEAKSSCRTWDTDGPEIALREACEKAWDTMVENTELWKTTIPNAKKWEGKWEA